jgi:hypothetical protein
MKLDVKLTAQHRAAEEEDKYEDGDKEEEE